MTAKAARYGSRSPASGRIPAAAEASCRTRAPTAIPSPVASCALVADRVFAEEICAGSTSANCREL